LLAAPVGRLIFTVNALPARPGRWLIGRDGHRHHRGPQVDDMIVAFGR
jgi:hypothetical protein